MMNQNTRVVTRPLTAYGVEPEHNRLAVNVDDQLLFDDFNKDVWDEGGKSHCGYSEGVHDILMTLGESVYYVLGEPSEDMQKCMKGVGSYFMEMSYAVRDIQRGQCGDVRDLIVMEDDCELELEKCGSNLSEIQE